MSLRITTSWDDGDPADLRLAQELAACGLGATFYLCREFDGTPRLSEAEMRELAALPGVEIGSHTVTHPDLRKVPALQLRREMHDSKQWLEDVLQQPVTSFCYPMGLNNRTVRRAAKEAGYWLARSTQSTHVADGDDPFRVPTSLQMYPHSAITQARHAVKEWDLPALRNIQRALPWSTDVATHANRLLTLASQEQQGVLHLWGHSWEIDRASLWSPLRAALNVLSEWPDAIFSTNAVAYGSSYA